MSDISPWQSPSGATPPVPSGPVPPGAVPPPGGFGGPPPPPPPPPFSGQAGGYIPPPRPGLIPLAPMGLGVILGASFRVLRRNPRPVVGFSLAIHLILAVINIAVTAIFTLGALGKYFDVLNSVSSSGQFSQSSAIAAGSSLLVASATTFIAQIFTYAGNAVLQGIITTEVSRGTVAEKLPLSALWARTRGRVLPLLGWAGLTILAIVVVLGIFAGIVALLFAFGGDGGRIVGVILSIVLVLGSIALGIWLSTKLSLVPSALVIEHLTIRRAIVRSWTLTRGFFWRTFGIEILVSIIITVAAYVVEIPVTAIIQIITLLGNPTGVSHTTASLTATFGTSELAGEIVGALIATITAVISTSATALIYIDLRIRKEGLDLALMRYVDARAAGETDVPDPYLATATGMPARPDASPPDGTGAGTGPAA